MVEILVKNNIDEIFEEVNNYVDETKDLPLVRVDDVIVFIGIDERSEIYFLLEDDETIISIKYVDYVDNCSRTSLKDVFDSIMHDLTNN